MGIVDFSAHQKRVPGSFVLTLFFFFFYFFLPFFSLFFLSAFFFSNYLVVRVRSCM